MHLLQMASDYKSYYSIELRRLRQYAQEFAQANPAIAPMLGSPSVDPDIERLLEGVAFLNGHTRQKLDDEFPEIAQELSSMLMPQILRPVPAATMIAFEPKASLKEPALVPSGTELASVPIEGVSCRFRTTVDVSIEQIQTGGAKWLSGDNGQVGLQLSLSMEGGPAARWPARLRLFLGDHFEQATNLLMLLSCHVQRIELVGGQGRRVSANSIFGFPGFDEPLIPQPRNGMPALGLVRELLHFPEKFLFVQIQNLDTLAAAMGTNLSLEIWFNKISQTLPELTAKSFLPNVSPAVNLFAQSAEPVSLTHEVPDYLVLPDGLARQHHQIFSVESVTGLRQGQAAQRSYQPFSLLQFGAPGRQLTYRTTVRPAMNGDWVETYLSVAYEADEVPVPETLSIELTCTNRWLPEKIKLGEVCAATDTSPERCSFRNITAVKGAVDAPRGEELLWASIGHTALNFMSLADLETTRSLLRLYNSFRTNDHGARAANERQIDGIVRIETAEETRLHRGTMIRGQLLRMHCDAANWPSAGALYLWGCVLARFFATYASINIYTRFEIIDSAAGVEYKWPAMLGSKPLL